MPLTTSLKIKDRLVMADVLQKYAYESMLTFSFFVMVGFVLGFNLTIMAFMILSGTVSVTLFTFAQVVKLTLPKKPVLSSTTHQLARPGVQYNTVYYLGESRTPIPCVLTITPISPSELQCVTQGKIFPD